MALLADLDPASVPNTPSQLEPADTLDSVDRLARLAAAPPTPAISSVDELARLGAGNFPVHIDQPAPATRAGLGAMRQKLRFESEYQPAQTLTPEGTNPQIVYPKMEDTSGNPVTDTLAQGGLGILQAGAQIGRKAAGLAALSGFAGPTQSGGPQQALDQGAEFANVNRGLEAVGKSIGGAPGVRQVTSMVVGSAPELALGGPAGLAGIATTFGASAAGNAYADAKEQGYEHPEAYALISGLLAAGTSLIPGYRGRNLVAKAMDEIGSPSWKQYLAQTVGQYMGKGILTTHGVSNALMMGIQTTLQGLLDQQTINPDLQWKDIVENAALSAGMGGLIGEGFGSLGQAAHLSTRKAQVGAILKEYIDGVNNSIMAGNPRQAGHELRAGIVPATESVPAPATHEEEPSASVAARNNPAPAQSDLPAGWARPQPTQSDMDYGAGGEMPKYENPMGSSLRTAKTPEPIVPGVPPKPPEVVKGALKPASPAVAAQPEISPAFKAASESVNTAKHQGELDSAMKAIQKNKKLSTDEALELGAAAADLRRTLPPDPASLPKIQKPEPAKQVASDWLEKLRAKKEAVKEAKVQKAKSTKLEPALTPEVAQVYKDKLLANMGGRHMDITAGSYAEGDSHLRLVLGKDAPSWSKLEAANVVTSEKLPNGQVRVKVKQVEVTPAVVPTAESRVKAGIKPEHVRITVSPEQEGIPGSGYVQVDEVHPKLGNTFSSNAEALNALGFKMPSTAELKTLPKGQYTLPEAVAKLKESKLPITKVVTKGSLRVKGLEGLPKKGERIPVGEFYITRNRLGKVVLMTEGVDRALATLRKESPEALTQKAIMEDLVARESGNRTKFWEVPEVKRGALAKAGKEVRKESAQADPEQFQKDVMGAMPKGPEGDALVEAMLRGAVDPVLVRKLAGELVAEKGAKVTGEELVDTLKQGVKQYLAGKLKERTEAGQAGHTPAEITSGMDAKAIKALYPDEKALAGRVLGILVGNRQVDLEVQNKYAAGAVAPVAEEEGTGFRGPVEVRDPDALTPVGKGGHTHEDVVTQFEDSDLDTPTKEKAAKLVNDIKQEVLSGDTKRYDQGLEILTKTFGFSPGKAAEWMDSETLFMAPGKSGTRTLPNGKPDSGKLRPATREDFGPAEAAYEGLKGAGALESTPIAAVEKIAAGGGNFSPLAKALLAHRNEIERVSMGNVGGRSAAPASYDPDSNSIKVSLPPSDGSYLKMDPDRLEQAILHEVGHALLVRRLEVLPHDSPLRAEIERLLNKFRDNMGPPNDDVFYAGNNAHEFLTMALSNADTRAVMERIDDGGTTLWQRIKIWARRLLFGDKPTLLKSTERAIDQLLDTPAVSNVGWMEAGGGWHDPLNYPEIRNPRQLREYTEFQDLPKDEQETLTRYAGAGNVWLKSPDVQSVLSGVPKEALGLLKATIGNRLDVLQALEGRPGQAQTLQEIMADPNVPMEIKQSTSLGVLHNLLWFRRSGELLRSKFENKFLALVEGREKLDKGINEQTARVQALEGAIDRLTSEFKSSVMVDKRTAVDAESMEQLNRLIALADELKGDRRSALSRVITSMAENLDLETLITVKDPAELSRLYDEHFPATPETAQLIGASEETIKLAAILLSRASTARDELLSLKLLRDEELQKGVFALNKQVNEDLRTKNIDKIIDQFSTKVDRLATRKERERAIWKQLYANKLKQIREVKKAHLATQAMGDILKTGTFRDLEQLVVNNHKLQQPMKYLLDTGVIQYTHPLDRTKIDIGTSFNAAEERENLQKLSNIIEAARLYVSDPTGAHYTPAEAAFWKEEIAKSAFLLDPSISYGARKLVGAAYDPYKLSNFLAQYLMVPEFELRRVGGRAAIDVINCLQALSAVDSQASNLKRSWDAAITLSADKAAKAHKIPIEQWHSEILNPLIASRQTIGWTSLRPGSETIYGHTILAEDEAAFKAQRDMDRRLVEIATTGQGNTAVVANASRIKFKSPGGRDLTRTVSHTGPDTMSRRIDPGTRGLAFQWSQDANVAKRVQFLNDNFERVVLGHLVTSGAPDYSIGSKYQELYRAVMKTHGDNPIINVDDLLTRLFDAQDGRIAPEYQASKDELLRNLVEELNQAFNNVAGYHEGTPKPDVGALLRVVDTDNSFTAARGRLIAPSTFYNYGLTFEGQRLGRIHSAKAYYTLKLSGQNGLIDNLIKSVDGLQQDYAAELKRLEKGGQSTRGAQATIAKRTEAEQKRGELLLTYEQTNFALRRLNLLKEEFARLLGNTGAVNDPDARQLVTTAQSFVAANVLGGVQSQNNNAFGGLTNLMLIDKMVLGRSATLSAAQLGIRVLLTKGPAEIAANLTKFVDPSNKWVLATLRNPATRVITGWMADVIDARMDLHKEMEKYGLSPTANVRQDMKALLTMPSGRPQLAPTNRLQSGVRRLESALGTISTPLSAFAPRLVDRFINELTVWKANDIEDMLRKNAWRYGQAREQAGMREPFQPSEWFGKKVSDKQAELFRALFTRTSMSLDNLMWRYYDAMKGASETARKTMPLFTPEESASFQYSLAQDVNLATFANRPTSTKGGRGRNLIGLFWGFPSWQASRLSDYLARASTDKSTAAHIPTILMATIALAAMGAASVKVTKELKDWIYGEKSAYPDLTEAKNPGDAIQALSFGLFTYIPFLGNLVNNLTSDQSMRGLMDVNTKFVMLNFANDAVLLVKNIVQSHDLEHPLEDFLRRWSPLARIVVNRLPDQTGLTEYYNLAREARSLAPDSIPRRKRGAGQYDATPVTPMLQNMVNAAYNGDGTAFQKAANEYVQYKVGEGLSPQAAQESLRSAWRSRHPFVSQFGRMPTEAESAVIYQNADTDQRAAIDKANSIFETYGKVLGTNVALTSKGNTEPVVLSGGSGGGGSGGAKSARPAMGSLLARGGIAGSLLGSPAATGLAGSPALGGSLLTASGGGGANVSAPAGKAFQGPAKVNKGRGSLRLKTGHAGALRGERVGPTLKTSKVGNGKAIKMKKGSLRLRRPV